jgi:hypothetical protein
LDQLLDDGGFAPHDTDALRTGTLRDALVQIAARYGEIVTQCLNASPDLHLEAFSELLGGRARPAAAARVHVSFKPALGAAKQPNEESRPIPASRGPVPVPMYTRLAAQAGAGEPAIFETLADLELVRAEAVRAQFVEQATANPMTARSCRAGFGGDVLSSLAP